MKRQEEIMPLGAPGQPADTSATAVSCPFCGSADVELLSLFGSQLLTDQYYCRTCHTPFEHLRTDAPEREVSGPAE